MSGAHRRLAARADDLLCSLVVPAAIYTLSSATEAPSAALLAVLAVLACLSDYNCGSSLCLLGSAVAVLGAAWSFELGAGQAARLGLLAGCALLAAGSLLARGGGSTSGGEALLAGQAAGLLCAAAAGQLPQLLLFGAPLFIGERAAVIHILQTAFGFLLVFLFTITYLPSARTAVWLHLLLVLLAATVVVVSGTIIGTDLFSWAVRFATASPQRERLLAVWAALLAGAVLFAAALGARPGVGSSQASLRKLFHLLTAAVFVPGLLYDPVLLLAASGGLTFLFVIAEVVRVNGLQPWSRIIQTWFRPFLDSKDRGTLILSNIYLIAACSGVLWYLADHVTAAGSRQDLCLFAGVITVGVGDTLAAVVGSAYGRHRWPRSVKTMEGSLASAAAQLTFCYLLDHTGYLSIGRSLWRPLCVAVGVTTLVEAYTAQADNLLLPPLFVAALRLASRW